jgi:hypothetical protein
VAVLPGEGLVDEELQRLPRQGRGVLFNAIHREPAAGRASKQIVEAARSAKRMQLHASASSSLRYALFTEREPWLFMTNRSLCRPLWPECEEFRTLQPYLTDIRFYEDLPLPPVVERRERFQTWPQLWLKRILASLYSPYAETLVVDSDVHACPNFERLFDEYMDNTGADVALTLAPAPFGSSRNYNGAFRPGLPEAFANFTERNLGLQLLRTAKPAVVHLLALFRDVYLRQANDTLRVSIGNDQAAFREALFTLREDIHLQDIPEEIGCRHSAGCPDGCLVVHRHHQPDLAGKDYEAWKRQQQLQSKGRSMGHLSATQGP